MIATTCSRDQQCLLECSAIRNTYLAFFHYRHHNLALRITVTGDMAWELLNIRYQLRLLSLCCSAAHSAAESNCLTSDFSLERTQDQLFRRRRIKHIKASPVHLIAWRRQRMQSVPDERCCIGGVACSVSVQVLKRQSLEGEEAYQTCVPALATS